MHEVVKSYIEAVKDDLRVAGEVGRGLSIASGGRLISFLECLGDKEPDPVNFRRNLRFAVRMPPTPDYNPPYTLIDAWVHTEAKGGYGLNEETYTLHWVPYGDTARWVAVFESVPQKTLKPDAPKGKWDLWRDALRNALLDTYGPNLFKPEEIFHREFPATPDGAFVAAHVSEEAQYTPFNCFDYAAFLKVRRKDCDAPDEEATAKFQRKVRREVVPTSPGVEYGPIIKGPYNRLTMDMRSDGCGSTIPGARADWAPSQAVTYEPDLGEDLEISTEEERAWRAKR